MTALAAFLPGAEAGAGARLQMLEAQAYRILRLLLREVAPSAAGGREAMVAAMVRRAVLQQALDWESQAFLFELGIDAPGNDNQTSAEANP